MRIVFALVCGAAACLAACDPRAAASQKAAEPAVTSAAYETCRAAADCAEGLRCTDGVCLAARSRLGDYHAAVGELSLERGAISEAVAAYNLAIAQYEQDGLAVPADVYCAQGSALTEARMDPQMAEAAARVLHRCMLDVPPGSALYRGAMANLAVLGEVGLEPKLLARDQPADLYLTRQPKKPPLDKLVLAVKGDLSRSKSTYEDFLKVLGADEAKAKLAPCWEAHWKETREETMRVTLPFGYRLRLHPDNPALDKASLALGEVEEPGSQAQAAAQNCVRGVAEELGTQLAAKLKKDQRWDANITISLGSDK